MDSKDLHSDVVDTNLTKYDERAPHHAQDVYSNGTDVTLPDSDFAGTSREYLFLRAGVILKLAIIYLAVLNVGFDNSVTNTTLGMTSFRKYFGYEAKPGVYQIAAKYQSAWAGGTSAGQVATDLLGGWLADRYGRKFTLSLSVCVIIIATTIQVTAHNIGQIIAGKAVYGMGVGLYISFCTSYTAELAPSKLRGVACMGVNFCIQLGQWVGSGAALALTEKYNNVNDTRSFRYIFCLQYIFATLFLLAVYWLPESPVFFIHKDNFEKAESTVCYMYSADYDAKRHVTFLHNESLAEQQMGGLGKSIKYKELFQGRNLLRMMISACIIWPLFMGTAFWPNYQTYYFQLAGAKNPQAMNYGCTSVAIGTSLVAYFLIETVGRRKLWIMGVIGMTCANLIGGFMSIPFAHGDKAKASAVATAMVFIWNGFYDIGPANMGYAITSEVPSSRMRVRNNAFVHVFSHLTGFAFTYAVPYMYTPDAGNLGLKIGYVWGSFGIIFIVWGFFFIPDLKKLNFYEIDQLFESRASVRHFGNARFDEKDALILSSVFKNSASPVSVEADEKAL